jgi:phosphoglycolate phosphatase-like HAD superfamily hydrolase
MRDETRNPDAYASDDARTLSFSERRILLWDIDGTLIRSTRAGIFKDYTAPAIAGIFGTAGRLSEMSVSGMTDLQIVGEALRDEGFTPEQIRERLDELRTLYMREMERVTATEANTFYLLPGVREILEATATHPRYASALLTGNLEVAAQLKLRLVGLTHFFQLPGAFGEDSHDRRDLPALARERISRQVGFELRPQQLIVIGDTPNDIACAKHYGARAVAVATGRLYSAEDLLAHEPDALLNDLSDTELVMRTFDAL